MSVVALALSIAAAQAAPEFVAFESERQQIGVSLASGLPAAWESCAGDCGSVAPFPLMRDRAGGTRLRFQVPGDSAATAALNAIGYTAERARHGDRRVVVMTSRSPVGGRMLRQRYEFDEGRRMLAAVIELPPRASLELAGGGDLVPAELPGFGGIYSNARAVVVAAGNQRTLADGGDDPVAGMALAAGDWVGVRGRFWTLVARTSDPLLLDASENGSDAPVLSLRPADAAATTLRLEFYGGPVARPDLARAAPELAGMLYAVLWEPLRRLSFGLQWILDRWHDLVGRAWLAILLLSLTVKLLMAPLIMVAERWQADVNRTRSLLEPELAAIRREIADMARDAMAHRQPAGGAPEITRFGG